MKCKDCEKFDSYETQGGLPHWFEFGFCQRGLFTVGKRDTCKFETVPMGYSAVEERSGESYEI